MFRGETSSVSVIVEALLGRSSIKAKSGERERVSGHGHDDNRREIMVVVVVVIHTGGE